MCGQIFCNQCSSFYIEQGVVGQTVRCCRLCYDQLGASYDQDVKPQLPLEKRINTRSNVNSLRRQSIGGGAGAGGTLSEADIDNMSNRFTELNNNKGGTDGQGIIESPMERDASYFALEHRANSHLLKLVHLLVSQSTYLKENCDEEMCTTWEGIIVKLVKEVVNYVDPDVRSGDSLDIRPYVKLKVIPGGSLEDNAFINGVVFRKNVSHKKMANEKFNPRLLLLGGVSYLLNSLTTSISIANIL